MNKEMNNIKSTIRLDCNEELEIKYFAKDESITNATIDCSELLEYINEIEDKNERLNNIIEHIENICKSSIASVDKILLDEKEIKVKDGIVQNRNNYQIVRLKAYRTKSKEILGRIKELKGVDKE